MKKIIAGLLMSLALCTPALAEDKGSITFEQALNGPMGFTLFQNFVHPGFGYQVFVDTKLFHPVKHQTTKEDFMFVSADGRSYLDFYRSFPLPAARELRRLKFNVAGLKYTRMASTCTPREITLVLMIEDHGTAFANIIIEGNKTITSKKPGWYDMTFYCPATDILKYNKSIKIMRNQL